MTYKILDFDEHFEADGSLFGIYLTVSFFSSSFSFSTIILYVPRANGTYSYYFDYSTLHNFYNKPVLNSHLPLYSFLDYFCSFYSFYFLRDEPYYVVKFFDSSFLSSATCSIDLRIPSLDFFPLSDSGSFNPLNIPDFFVPSYQDKFLALGSITSDGSYFYSHGSLFSSLSSLLSSHPSCNYMGYISSFSSAYPYGDFINYTFANSVIHSKWNVRYSYVYSLFPSSFSLCCSDKLDFSPIVKLLGGK